MNLTDKYPHVNNKMYAFEPVETSSRGSYFVGILKYSSHQDRHVFEDHLNRQSYVNMLGEPDMVFDELFENTTERELTALLSKEGIEYDVIGRYTGMMSDFVFDKPNADRCVVLMQKQFQHATR